MNCEKRNSTMGAKLFVAACLFLLIAGNASAAGNVTVSMSVWGMPWEDLVYTDILIPIFQKQNPSIKVEFQRKEKLKTLPLLIASIAGGHMEITSMPWPTRMAAVTIVLVPVLILYSLTQRYIIRAMAITSGIK